MSKDCFAQLCNKIIQNVGEHNFRSEEYICHLLDGDANFGSSTSYMSRYSYLARAARSSIGDFISGEVKLALTLRILSGGTYMDVAFIFDIGETYVYQIFFDVIVNWIQDDRLVKINGVESAKMKRE